MGLKLYRGISAADFQLLSPKMFSNSRSTWRKILAKRARGNRKFPVKLSKEVNELEKIARKERQHFTDNKKIAHSYARKEKGVLVELNVPIEDALKHFRLEFQNFSKRKKNFEIVYVVDANLLRRNKARWKLKTTVL